ncbi:hypothetical protein [Mobilicoccus caccae]|uniref:Mannosyltransferase n=1 Tax=Mobilicoccus caccae TaxID=1859295 RepID=A0ABQ6IL49_9MICO|nr:hypothetical protein [Mobilicoccus caccae]GMA38633.1 hypothetical protein GCM10025883_06780 [Mobilicoccus caccae]
MLAGIGRAGLFAVALPVAGLVLTLVALAATALGDPALTGSPFALLAWWWLPVPVLVMLLPAAPTGEAREVGDSAPSPGGVASSQRPGTHRIVVAVALALLPLAYVVGTNGNYWIAQSRAAVFWVVAGVVLLAGLPVQQRVYTAGAAVFALIVAALSLGYGYRYTPPLEAAVRPALTAVTTVSPEGATLRLTAEDAATSRQLAAVAAEHHLEGVPMLDVTGASPGYIRQLGGHPVGSSWLLGGYRGSLDAALAAVSHDREMLDGAWVLDAPDSRRRIEGLLPALGRSPDPDYEVVTTFTHHLGYEVQLLRPVIDGT